MKNSPYYTINFGEHLRRVFPHYACKRCGFDTFTVIPPMESVLFDELAEKLRGKPDDKDPGQELDMRPDFQNSALSMFVEVVCNRCGSSERFFGPVLVTAHDSVGIA